MMNLFWTGLIIAIGLAAIFDARREYRQMLREMELFKKDLEQSKPRLGYTREEFERQVAKQDEE